MRPFFLLIAFILMGAEASLHAKEYPLPQLGIFANALNIEGGRVPRDKLRQDQIWANLCIALDQPFCTGKDLDVITMENAFPLKESSLDHFDEGRVNLAYYNILRYYIQHAHLLTGKDHNDVVRIMVQVHRNRSGPAHVALLKSIVAEIPKKPQVELSWIHAVEPLSLEKYTEQDVIISISMVAGLDHSSIGGTLVLPSIFIPFDLRTMQLMLCHTYSVENHLWHILADMIQKQDFDENVQIVAKFTSPNLAKKPSACRSLELNDFQRGVNVEVNGMFYPHKLPAYFKLEE